MSRVGRGALALCLFIGLLAVSVADDDVAEAAPPEQRVLMVSDSVGLGARAALPAAFPAHWDVNVIGTPAMFVEQLEASHVKPFLAANRSRVGDHVVIAGGYNYPYWDPARFDRSIDSMIATLTAAGVEHIYWVTLREVKPQYISGAAWRQVQPYYWYFPTVNQHLERAVARHRNLTLVDWAANADQPGLTYDAIHLNTTGARLYSSLVARAVHNSNSRQPNRAVLRVPVGNADAVSLNLTATGTRHDGYFSAYPCDGSRPVVSNLNHVREHTVASSAIVPVGPSGDVCVYNHTASQVIVDITGRFTAGADIAPGSPRRLFDAREVAGGRRATPGQPMRLRVSDGSAEAVVLTVTAVNGARTGFVSVHKCGTTARTSTVNFRPGVPTPNTTIVRPDANGDICLTASQPVHLIVDRFASLGPDSTVEVVEPFRTLDTRTTGFVPGAGKVVKLDTDAMALAGDPADGLAFNLTIDAAQRDGFATAYGCAGGLPPTSSVNYPRTTPIANFVIVEPDANGDICIYTQRPAHVIVDVLGTTGAGFQGFRPQRLVDTRG